MNIQIASVLASGETAEVCREIRRALDVQLHGATPVLVCAFASTRQDLGVLVKELSATGSIVIGASTAGEFTEGRDAKASVSVFALAGDEYRATAGIGGGLATDPEGAITRALEGQPRSMPDFPHRTAITLLDPLAGNGEEVALMLAATLGPDEPLAGGAAGDDLKMKQTLVAFGDRVASDALVVAQIFSKRPLGLGVRHGHGPLSEPLRVTRADGATVYEIEGRPAWDVWREQTRQAAAKRQLDVDALDEASVGAFLLEFQAGLANGSGYKIRAPLARGADGSISFATAVPEGSVLRVMQSNAAAQVASAIGAAESARDALGGGACAGALVFDCICRKLILGDGFADAVRGMSAALGNARLAGFETYGEVGLGAGEMSGFHNTTSVVLAFPA